MDSGNDALASTALLLQRAKSGHRESLEQLFELYYPIVVRIVELRLRRRLRGNPDVEDIAQDTLLDVFRGLDHFEMRSEGDFRYWLATVVGNNVRDRFRRENAEKRGGGRVRLRSDMGSSIYTESFLAGREPTPSHNARGNELEDRIEDVLMNELEDPYREVIILRKLCGMSYDEVAKAMKYERTSSVRSLYTRALQKLRRAL